MTTNHKTGKPVLGHVLTDVIVAIVCYGLPVTGFLFALGELGSGGLV